MKPGGVDCRPARRWDTGEYYCWFGNMPEEDMTLFDLCEICRGIAQQDADLKNDMEAEDLGD